MEDNRKEEQEKRAEIRAILSFRDRSLWRMEELVERLVRWGIHPEDLITHEFPIEKAGEAYQLMAKGNCGKVAVVFGDQKN